MFFYMIGAYRALAKAPSINMIRHIDGYG